MTPQEISAAYRARHASLVQQLGRRPTVNDPEFWELENWYMDTHRALIKDRPVVEQPRVPVVSHGTPDPLQPALTLLESDVKRCCRECGAHIPPTGRRGRPPTRCEKCRTP